MKKILIIFIAIFSFFNVNAIGRNEYVIDNSKIFSKDTENFILELSNYLKDQEQIDYVVVSAKTNNDLKAYTNELYDELHISNKGILMVVDKDSRSIQIQVGKRLSNVISDSVINKYIDKYMIGYLKNEEWDDGVRNGYTAFYKLLCNYYGIDSSILEVYDGNSFLNNYRMLIISVIIFICTMIGYNLIRYYRDRYVRKPKDKVSKVLNDIIFYSCIFINVELFIVAYYIGLNYFLVVFAIEIISILSSYFNESENAKKKRIEVKRIRRKKKRHG